MITAFLSDLCCSYWLGLRGQLGDLVVPRLLVICWATARPDCIHFLIGQAKKEIVFHAIFETYLCQWDNSLHLAFNFAKLILVFAFFFFFWSLFSKKKKNYLSYKKINFYLYVVYPINKQPKIIIFV